MNLKQSLQILKYDGERSFKFCLFFNECYGNFKGSSKHVVISSSEHSGKPDIKTLPMVLEGPLVTEAELHLFGMFSFATLSNTYFSLCFQYQWADKGKPIFFSVSNLHYDKQC